MIEIRLVPDCLQDLVESFNDLSAIDSIRVAADACVFFFGAGVSGVAGVSAGSLVSVVPCSHEHIRRNSAVKALSSETAASWCGDPAAISNAVTTQGHRSRSHDAPVSI